MDEYVEPIACDELDRHLSASGAEEGEEVAETMLADAEHERTFLLTAGAKAGLDVSALADVLSEREAAVKEARDRLRAARARKSLDRRRGVKGSAAYRLLDATSRNLALQDVLSGVVVARSGKGRKLPLSERVRVLGLESEVQWLSTRHGDHAAGIEPIALPSVDAPGVLT